MSGVAQGGPDRRRSLGGKYATTAATPARRRRSQKRGVPAQDKPLLRVWCVASAVRAGTCSRKAGVPRAEGRPSGGRLHGKCTRCSARSEALRTTDGGRSRASAQSAHRTLPPTATSGWAHGGTFLSTRWGRLRAHPLQRNALDGGTVRPAGTRRLNLSEEASKEQHKDECGAGRTRPPPQHPHRPARERPRQPRRSRGPTQSV